MSLQNYTCAVHSFGSCGFWPRDVWQYIVDGVGIEDSSSLGHEQPSGRTMSLAHFGKYQTSPAGSRWWGAKCVCLLGLCVYTQLFADEEEKKTFFSIIKLLWSQGKLILHVAHTCA